VWSGVRLHLATAGIEAAVLTRLDHVLHSYVVQRGRGAMALLDDARVAALQAYRQAAESGADRDTALHVALAKLRASYPTATEWELRSWLAKAMAAERQGAKIEDVTH
jgi:hypothetical protein